MKNWFGPGWCCSDQHIFWQVNSEWSERAVEHSGDVVQILKLYEKEFEDRLTKDEYVWLAEHGCVKTNGDYDGHFKSEWQIVILESNEIKNKLISIGDAIKEKHHNEFNKLKEHYVEEALKNFPLHLKKMKEYELQFIFCSDGWFLLHCIKTLLNNGKLKEPTPNQRRSVSTIITRA